MPIELAISSRSPSIRIGRLISSIIRLASSFDARGGRGLAGDDELVAAESRDSRLCRGDQLQAAGDFGEQLVTGLVTE
jgi:hypothetical protein